MQVKITVCSLLKLHNSPLFFSVQNLNTLLFPSFLCRILILCDNKWSTIVRLDLKAGKYSFIFFLETSYFELFVYVDFFFLKIYHFIVLSYNLIISLMTKFKLFKFYIILYFQGIV